MCCALLSERCGHKAYLQQRKWAIKVRLLVFSFFFFFLTTGSFFKKGLTFSNKSCVSAKSCFLRLGHTHSSERTSAWMCSPEPRASVLPPPAGDVTAARGLSSRCSSLWRYICEQEEELSKLDFLREGETSSHSAGEGNRTASVGISRLVDME